MTTPRILFNAKDQVGINSGYGILSRYLTPKLAERYGPENIVIYSPVYQRDYVDDYYGMRVVGGSDFGYGENMILDHYVNYNCNMLLQVGDVWPLGVLPDLAAENKVLWVQWIAVDWVGNPKNLFYRIKPAHKLIPFSKYGHDVLSATKLESLLPHIWLGLNTDLWGPIDSDTISKVMPSLGFEKNTFNIVIVGANQERKKIRQALEAMATFRKIKPEADVRLYLHSHIKGERDFAADLDELGLQGLVTMPDQYIMSQGGYSEVQMCRVFNCADVVIDVAMEGFGYPILQAQAVGCPAIVLSEGAGPELTVFGWETPPVAIETTSCQMSVPIPNIISIAASLEECWKLRKENGHPLRSPKAIDFVKNNFSWDIISKQWFKVIDDVMRDRDHYCMDIPEPSDSLNRLARERVEL